MRRLNTLSMRQQCALALILVQAVGLAVVLAQMAVSMQASAPSRVQSQSVRYGGGGLLPSEQRYVRSRSGLLPSEWRDAQWGSLPSQGRIASAPGASASLRYPSYNAYYNRTANSFAPAMNRYSRSYSSPTSSPSLRYNHISTGNYYKPYTPSHTYSFRQNYNSYQTVAKPSGYIKPYKPPSIRYNY